MTDKTTIQEGTLSSDVVMAQLRERLSKVNSTVSQQEVSAVTEVADGIARVAGLRSAMAGELLVHQLCHRPQRIRSCSEP